MSIDTYPAVNASTANSVLGYAETTSLSQAATTAVALPGLSVTVAVPSGRRLRITGWCYVQNSGANRSDMYLNQNGSQIQAGFVHHVAAGINTTLKAEVIVSPSAGTYTYSVNGGAQAGTSTFSGSPGYPAYILVEDITGGTGGPGPIQLGYAEVTTNQGPFTSETDLNGLTVTVNVPAGRRIKITAKVLMISTVADDVMRLEIYDGSTRVALAQDNWRVTDSMSVDAMAVVTPTAGTHTYKLVGFRPFGSGNLSLVAGPDFPAFILVEDITGTSAPGGLLPSSQTLAYAENTAGSQAVATGLNNITGLSATVNVPGGRRLKISTFVCMSSGTAGHNEVDIKDELGTKLNRSYYNNCAASQIMTHAFSVIVSPSAGQHTYTVRSNLPGAGTLYADSNEAYILVEDVTGSVLPMPAASVPVGVLAYVPIIVGDQQLTAGGVETVLTNYSANVAVPAGRILKITVQGQLYTTSVDDGVSVRIKENGSQIVMGEVTRLTGTIAQTYNFETIRSPSAGSHTYTVTAQRVVGSGTVTHRANTSVIGYIIIEDITPTPAPANTAPSSTLGYAEVTATQGTFTAATDLTGLAVTVTVPAGRRIRIKGSCGFLSTVADDRGTLLLQEGATILQNASTTLRLANTVFKATPVEVVITPTAGMHTYKLVGLRGTGTGNITMDADPTRPAFILVEDVTGVSVDVHDHDSSPTSTLGYAETVTSQTGMTGVHDLVGLSTTVTVPAGRRLRIRGFVRAQNNTASCGLGVRIIQDGVQLNEDSQRVPVINEPFTLTPEAIVTPSAGAHTYKLQGSVQGGGTAITIAGATYPAFIIVEDISGHGIPGHTHTETDDTGWINLTLINGWVVYDNLYGPNGFSGLATAPLLRKKAGIVYLRGLVRSGTLGAAMAVLPVGFRPGIKLLFAAMGDSNVINRIDVDAGGQIIHAAGGSNGWCSINNLRFPADA